MGSSPVVSVPARSARVAGAAAVLRWEAEVRAAAGSRHPTVAVVGKPRRLPHRAVAAGRRRSRVGAAGQA